MQARIADSEYAGELQGRRYTIPRPIAAIQAAPHDLMPVGPVTTVPPATTVTVLGQGFHDGIVKVRAENSQSLYFVFLDDLA